MPLGGTDVAHGADDEIFGFQRSAERLRLATNAAVPLSEADASGGGVGGLTHDFALRVGDGYRARRGAIYGRDGHPRSSRWRTAFAAPGLLVKHDREADRDTPRPIVEWGVRSSRGPAPPRARSSR